MEKTINIIPLHSIYEINTGFIFNTLTDFTYEKWRKYNREFLSRQVKDALIYALIEKKIISEKYDETNGEKLKEAQKIHTQEVEDCKDPLNFPFPEFFLQPDTGSNYWNVIDYSETCILKKTDNNFELFFALQLSLMDIGSGNAINADEFLQYHLSNTYENNLAKFKSFLDRICLEFNEFLQDKFKPLITLFFENKMNSQETNPEVDMIEELLRIFNLSQKYVQHKNIIKHDLSPSEREFKVRCLDIMQMEELIVTEYAPGMGGDLLIALTPKGKGVNLKGGYKKYLAEKEFKNNNIKGENMDMQLITKLKWLGSPSQFAFVFLELANKGFIEIPSTSGEASYSKYAKVCWELFEFNKTTQENLKKEMNPNKNTLTDGVRGKFTFPHIEDISKNHKK